MKFLIRALIPALFVGGLSHDALAQNEKEVETDSKAGVVEPSDESAKEDARAKKGRLLKRVLAVFEMEQDGKPMGTFKAKLHVDKAPLTTANFIGLAAGEKSFKEFDESKGKPGKMVKRPYYDGLTFHRIVPNFIIQGGCPFGTGRGDPGFTIQDEIVRGLRHDRPGVLSMANRGVKNSGTSQFFITLSRQTALDGKNSIFGQVVEGMDVVNAIAKSRLNPLDNKPRSPIVMKSVSIVYEYAD